MIQAAVRTTRTQPTDPAVSENPVGRRRWPVPVTPIRSTCRRATAAGDRTDCGADCPELLVATQLGEHRLVSSYPRRESRLVRGLRLELL